jgi:hypothetical protein
MKLRLLLALILCVLGAACAAEPEIVVETVVVESTVEVPVTVEVTRQVEVTRPVEVTVETVREVEVTRQVPVEVTKLVEVVVTATPTEEPEPTVAPATASSESTIQASAPSGGVAASLLQSCQTTAENIGQVTDMMDSVCRGGMYSGVGKLNCSELVRLNDAIVSAPTYNVSGAPMAVQNAYGQYRWAIDTFAAGNVSLLVNDCRTQHAGETETEISANTGCDLAYNHMQEPRSALNSAISTLQQHLGG